MIKTMMLAVVCVSVIFIVECGLKINPHGNTVFYVIQTSKVLNSSFDMVKVSKNKIDMEGGKIVLGATSDSLKQGDKVDLITFSKDALMGTNLYIELAVKQ
jgi:hypothetical protein